MVIWDEEVATVYRFSDLTIEGAHLDAEKDYPKEGQRPTSPVCILRQPVRCDS